MREDFPSSVNMEAEGSLGCQDQELVMEVMERQAEMIRSFVAVDREQKKSEKSCISSIYGSIYHSVSDPDPLQSPLRIQIRIHLRKH